jgi:sensor histidine kinase YesM
VTDDGVGFVPGTVTPRGLGIGLENVNSRLTKLFGARSALRITSAPGRGTTVAFTVPARPPAAAAAS